MNPNISRRTTISWSIIIISLAGLAGCDTFTLLGLPSANSNTDPALGNSPISNTLAAEPGSNIVSNALSTDTTLLEQLALERINRARLLPAAEAAAGGISINEGLTQGTLNTISKQPLAMNAMLRRSAQQHSADMLNRNYFAHNTPEGVTPFNRMRDAGFLFIIAGENLAWRGTTATLDPVETVENEHNDLFIDRGIAGRGHRVTMLNKQFREVGISIIRGRFTRSSDGVVFSDSIMHTQDYATSPQDSIFVLGVVYNDANQNGQYDHGEGVANSSVSLDGMDRVTNQAGGYSFEVLQPGTFTLRFSSGGTQIITLNLGDPNIKIDLIDQRQIVINLGLGQLN